MKERPSTFIFESNSFYPKCILGKNRLKNKTPGILGYRGLISIRKHHCVKNFDLLSTIFASFLILASH